MNWDEIARMILSEAGVVAMVLFVGNVGLALLYASERKDRRDAWAAFNQMAQQTNDTLADLTLVLEIIKERMK